MSPDTPLTEPRRVERLVLPDPAAGPVDVVLDTDTYNEIDDQFALAYALLSPGRINLQAVYAAPFVNERSETPAEGMSKSYDEIHQVLERLGRGGAVRVCRGSERWVKDAGGAVNSDACTDLIGRAASRHEDDPPLYVVTIGAPTNVASALLERPELADRIVVVWLGGHPVTWPSAQEFNLGQDMAASRVLFDSGVPLVSVPCINVAQKLRTTVAELERYLQDRNPLCDFLLSRYRDYEVYETPRKQQRFAGRPIAYGKEVWDVAPIGWLIDPAWAPSGLIPSPILTDQLTWSHNPRRHLIRQLVDLNRDMIFGDLFTKLATLQGAVALPPEDRM